MNLLSLTLLINPLIPILLGRLAHFDLFFSIIMLPPYIIFWSIFIRLLLGYKTIKNDFDSFLYKSLLCFAIVFNFLITKAGVYNIGYWLTFLSTSFFISFFMAYWTMYLYRKYTGKRFAAYLLSFIIFSTLIFVKVISMIFWGSDYEFKSEYTLGIEKLYYFSLAPVILLACFSFHLGKNSENKAVSKGLFFSYGIAVLFFIALFFIENYLSNSLDHTQNWVKESYNESGK